MQKNIFLIKKDVFGKLPRKSPIGSANTQWGMENLPLSKVSLYIEVLII